MSVVPLKLKNCYAENIFFMTFIWLCTDKPH